MHMIVAIGTSQFIVSKFNGLYRLSKVYYIMQAMDFRNAFVRLCYNSDYVSC